MHAIVVNNLNKRDERDESDERSVTRDDRSVTRQMMGGVLVPITPEEARQYDRQEELEHERQLAAIRAQSHALIWTGTPDDLKAAITAWCKSGWLEAESVQDALHKTAVHFVRPDGTAVIRPHIAETSMDPPIPLITETNPRKAFVDPLLRAKGWSIFRWAIEAKVSHATASDYLNEMTKPYPKTLKKLADALKVSVEQLPII